MRARLDEVVRGSLAVGRAVPAITTYEFATAQAVVSAAEWASRPVVLLVPATRFMAPGGVSLIRGLRMLADDASVPVVVQLDHAAGLAEIMAAVDSGADAVLADGSKSPLAVNAAFVGRVVDGTRTRGVVVEAEVGALGGDEDRSMSADAGMCTDPEDVAPFVETCGAHLLAVSVGNVHGAYRGKPQLRWEVIERISRASCVPLVLHGASGIPRGDVQRAITWGFGKINVNTELRATLVAAMSAHLPVVRDDGNNLLALGKVLHESTMSFAVELLRDLQAGPARIDVEIQAEVS